MRNDLGLLAVALLCTGILPPVAGAADASAPNVVVKAPVAAPVHGAALPDPQALRFEINRGQADSRAKFIAHARGANLYLTQAGTVLDFHNVRESKTQFDALALRYRFANANAHPRIEAEGRLPGRSNYFIGNDAKRWRTDIPNSARVRYHDVYPGVDVVYYGKDGQLEFDVEVAPGADVAAVRLRVDGADKLVLDDNGDLRVATAFGELVQRKPVVYQMIDGDRREIRGDYVLRDLRRDGSAHEVAFRVPDYDRRVALVFDPTLVASFLVGGSGSDVGTGVSADPSGNWYFAGYTNSTTTPFPTTVGAYQTTNHGGYDAFVRKISNDGSTVIYSTLIGGNADDTATGIGVDANGNAYITGNTQSSNFPVPNGIQTIYPGNLPGFVTALNANGNGLVYSTYLGGNGLTNASGIAVDATGNAYATGYTLATNLLTSSGAFQTSTMGQYSAFVFKLLPTGAQGYGTYIVDDLFGLGGDYATAITIDGEGNAYITGYTNSNFGGTYGGVMPASIGPGGGTYDILLARLNNTGTWLDWVTHIGGTNLDQARAIAVSDGHQIMVAASSTSTDLAPNTAHATRWGWIGHVDETGTQLLDSIWLGAAGANVFPSALVWDDVVVVGQTDNPGALTPQNPSALDCGGACGPSGGSTNAGFIAKFGFTASQFLAQNSLDRVTGGSGSSQTRIDSVALAPTTAAHDLAVSGSSDGTPPTATGRTTTGKRAFGAILDSALATLVPEVNKYFQPPIAEPGQKITLHLVIRNPNKTASINNISLLDVLPSCLGAAKRSDSYSGPNDPAELFSYGVNAAGNVFVNQNPQMQLVAGRSVDLNIPVDVATASAFGNCTNTTNPITSDQGTAPPASASLFVGYNPQGTFTWTGGTNNSTATGTNWNPAALPLSASDLEFPAGPANTNVINDLPTAQVFNAVTISGNGYNLGGNGLNLLYGIDSSGVNTIAAPVNCDAAVCHFCTDPAAAVQNLSGGINANNAEVSFCGAGDTNIGTSFYANPTIAPVPGRAVVSVIGPGKVRFPAVCSFERLTDAIDVRGGSLDVNCPMTNRVIVSGNGTLRGCSSCGDIFDRGDFYPCPSNTTCMAKVTSLTCDGGKVELDCGPGNTPCTAVNASGAVVSECDSVTIHLQNQPTNGTVFSNAITGSSNTGCPENAYATPSNVLLAAQCTATAVSLIVKATDDVFHNSF